MEDNFTARVKKQSVWEVVPSWEGSFKVTKVIHSNAYFVETLEGIPLPKALNGKYLKRLYPNVWQEP
jgi:hypothetical protein